MPAASAVELVRRVWADLQRDAVELEALEALASVPLPARLDVSGLAAGSVAAASLAAATAGTGPARRVTLDRDRIATSFTSERWFRIDGAAPDVWAPLSGFRRAADGWVRTHANYPHHAASLRRALHLGTDAGPEEVTAAIAARPAAEVEAAVVAEGGVCAVVHAEQPPDDARLREQPLVRLMSSVPGGRSPANTADPSRPLSGLRVLDLTRVIAGPVGTRALAQFGADVLRVDSPRLPEPEWQHLDTGAGKRSTLLDLSRAADRARFDELLSSADAVVLGYRPDAIARLGLDPRELVERHPRLVVGQLSAWGYDGPEAARRGFDSIVQAASGIAVIEGEGERPGALPAQALDHATGYLLAAAVVSMLDGRAGEARIARLSLRRTAAELLGMPRTVEPEPTPGLDETVALANLETMHASGIAVRVPAPAAAFEGASRSWLRGPVRWGCSEPVWLE